MADVRQTPAIINVATAAEHTIVAAATGKRIRVYAMWIQAAGTVAVTPKTNGTALSGALALVAQSFINFEPRSDKEPWFTTVAGDPFILSLAQAIQVSGIAYYVAE